MKSKTLRKGKNKRNKRKTRKKLNKKNQSGGYKKKKTLKKQRGGSLIAAGVGTALLTGTAMAAYAGFKLINSLIRPRSNATDCSQIFSSRGSTSPDGTCKLILGRNRSKTTLFSFNSLTAFMYSYSRRGTLLTIVFL